MAIYVRTEKSKELLDKLRKSIDDGNIKTWKYDNDGDFSHSPDQWQYNGWLRPFHVDHYLVFGIITPKNDIMTTVTYAVYHGRFIEMLLTHFDKEFEFVYASAGRTKYDIF